MHRCTLALLVLHLLPFLSFLLLNLSLIHIECIQALFSNEALRKLLTSFCLIYLSSPIMTVGTSGIRQ